MKKKILLKDLVGKKIIRTVEFFWQLIISNVNQEYFNYEPVRLVRVNDNGSFVLSYVRSGLLHQLPKEADDGFWVEWKKSSSATLEEYTATPLHDLIGKKIARQKHIQGYAYSDFDVFLNGVILKEIMISGHLILDAPDTCECPEILQPNANDGHWVELQCLIKESTEN